MDNSKLQKIQDSFEKSKNIAIAVGENPSIDEMGSALALYLSFQLMGKVVTVVSPTEPIVELSNLVGIDKVKKQFHSDGADLVVSFPYREGEIEKVSYTVENGFLNIVVKAGVDGLQFSERDVKYIRGGSNSGVLDLLIVIGSPSMSTVQSLFTQDSLKNVTIINIDYRQNNQGYGDIIINTNQSSSVSEQVTEILSELRTPVDNDIAQNLLDGIMFATNNFQSPNTSYLAFEMSGILMRQGAIRENGSHQQNSRSVNFMQKPIQQDPSLNKNIQPRNQDRKGNNQNRPNQYNQQKPVNQHSRITPQKHPNRQPVQQSQFDKQPIPQQTSQFNKQQNESDDLNPPTDWLTPKVYKGSSNV